MRVFTALALLCASCLYGETEHKDKATDYPIHAMAGKVAIGADYLIHSIPAGDQTFLAKDFLVVEVALFPAMAQPVSIDGNTFTLRLNGAKLPLASIPPGFVAASLKYPDWEQHPTAVASGGVGNAGVTIGPPTVARFPGDPNASHPLPRGPTAEERNGVERSQPDSADEVIARTALLEGQTDHPISGFLYFPYKGKIKSLKSIELIYQSKDGSVTLKLL
ncbi:MAG TPA: hypothetical protein VK335_00860 [Bryobacteraceae bacterium]|nr:hypothetical protein [Bryobacteraceae bacterium]